MTCSECSYILDDFDMACPRCGKARPPVLRRRATDRDRDLAAGPDGSGQRVEPGERLADSRLLHQAMHLLRPRATETETDVQLKPRHDLDSAPAEAAPGVLYTGVERRAAGCPGCGRLGTRAISEIHVEAGPTAFIALDSDGWSLFREEFGEEFNTKIAGVDLDGAAEPSAEQLNLARQLAPPRPPRYRRAAMVPVAWSIVVLGLLALVALQPQFHTVLMCLAVIGGVVAMAVVETLARHRSFDREVAAWSRSCGRWRDTLYCERCEIVYNQTTRERAGTESVLKIL